MAARPRTIWRCQQCGASALKWLGRCPDCGEYGSFVEELDAPVASSQSSGSALRELSLSQADTGDGERLQTGISELDRVLGGGLVTGSLVLIGGEPGIGKSTLLLQASASVADAGSRVLYVCGEESPSQIAMRARRLDIDADSLFLLPEVDVTAMEQAVRRDPPGLLVIDSIQTSFDPELAGAPGSVGQVRAVTSRLMRLAKDLGITTVIVGHVTKDGAIAGPRVLEHMVDTVLYFEGDRDHAFRIIRSVKNRFGASSEIGIFEMCDRGLQCVDNPSALLLGERAADAPGSAVMVTMEGSRPLLVEVQALVTPTYLQMPRRLSTGVDNLRLLQVIGVLERRAGISFAGHDIYVSVAGGVRVVEPAVDVPLALALLSARLDVPLPVNLAAFGEIGLTGGIRSVSHAEQRAREASRQGYDRLVAVLPRGVRIPEGTAYTETSGVRDLSALFAH
ncbi:MAG: DNA repair protein RadA [Actinobacteria bacterium HGW-Actinobacteria-10]|jgi:DNA repair protein RadA/Sms|nr:MAG: DNA repair protein RadA [Actinobacteria bacterium HGW-Actinobacteria-10]